MDAATGVCLMGRSERFYKIYSVEDRIIWFKVGWKGKRRERRKEGR
jgi:hypothetical protein